MRKSILLVLLLIAAVLSSCLSQTQIPSSTNQITSVATKAATSPAVPPPSSTSPAATTQVGAYPESSCTAVTKKPTAGPTIASIYPPVSSADWVKGPADAKVTILEYSDFQ